MVFLFEKFATATPAAGTIALFDETANLKSNKVKSYDRIIMGAGLIGGSAALDSAMEIKAGDAVLYSLWNHNTTPLGGVNDLYTGTAIVKGHQELIGEVTDAFAAQCYLLLYIVPKLR